MTSVRDKLEFIDIMRTQYRIGFLSKKESIANLHLKPTRNLYILFYSDELKVQQPKIYEKHAEFIIQLSKDSTNDASQNKFVIVDMDLHYHQTTNAKEIKIMWYQNRQQKSGDLLKEESPNNTLKKHESPNSPGNTFINQIQYYDKARLFLTRELVFVLNLFIEINNISCPFFN